MTDDFKVVDEEKEEEKPSSKVQSRPKAQVKKNKPAPIKNIKVEERKVSVTRTELAKQEEQSGTHNQSNVEPSLRQKAFFIDSAYILLLYYVSKSAPIINPIALAIIQYSKDQNVSHYIEKLPDFKLLLSLSSFFIFYVIFYLLPVIYSSRTLGKLICGLRIEDIEGGAPQKSSLLKRETIGKLINLITVWGMIKTLVHKEGRGLHDQMTDTVVIKVPVKEKIK